jgi:NAD(P)H-dependent glutamate synthase small subunit
MGKPTGFIEYLREMPLDRSPKERIKDWDEFHHHLDDKSLRTQAARCMDCGVPFCHTGKLINGGAAGCPVNNLIPEWNDLVYRGLWREALDRLHKTNNFPEFTGRVCPAPCEGSCVLGINNPPVTIKNIENSIIEHGFEEGWVIAEPPAARTGKKVAVVGSGPAGLAAAAQLNRAGHEVTVIERADRPGGLLMYGIPNMKLAKEEVVMRRIRLLEEEGVHFRCNANVADVDAAKKLRQEFDAVVLCTGSTQPRDLPVEGRNLAGVHFAMDYLTDATQAVLGKGPKNAKIHAKGLDVVVIGGGDTGTDCVGSAMRQGCRTLTQFEILSKPPAERADDNRASATYGCTLPDTAEKVRRSIWPRALDESEERRHERQRRIEQRGSAAIRFGVPFEKHRTATLAKRQRREPRRAILLLEQLVRNRRAASGVRGGEINPFAMQKRLVQGRLNMLVRGALRIEPLHTARRAQAHVGTRGRLGRGRERDLLEACRAAWIKARHGDDAQVAADERGL